MKQRLLFLSLLVMLMGVGAEGWGQTTYNLCTSVSDLTAGSKYIIVSSQSNGTARAMGYQNTNNRPQSTTEVTISSSSLTTTVASSAGDLAKAYEITLGGTSGAWTMQDPLYSNFFLKATSSSSNNLQTTTGSADWTITFSSNAAVMTCTTGSFTRNILRYNSSSSLFSCYSTGQSAVYLYKRVENTVNNPGSFSATTFSISQINLSATANANSDNIVVVYNGTGTFTTPTDGVAPGNVGDAFAGGIIHYKGAAASLTNHTSLTANTAYYYKAFSHDGSNNYSNGITANATTSKIEPTNQATNFDNGAITTSSLPLTWSSAAAGSQSPDGYLVLLNTGTITDPVDGADPGTGSLTISAGAATYKSSGTSATFTSAVAGTMYNVKMYSYTNSNSLINFNLSSPPTLNVATLPNAVSSASVGASGALSANISWSAASGYSAVNHSTLVFIKSVSSITAGTPTNSPSTYSANTAFSSGTAYQNDAAAYCVYNGDGTSVAVTGLAANTAYHVLIYTVVDASNSDDTHSYSSGITANGTTAQLTAPTANAASKVSSTGFIANWDELEGAGSYKLDVSEYATFATAGVNTSDLFISEYIDGVTGNNKAIEIYNGTGATVDLSNYRIWLISNGGTWPESEIVLSGTLLNDDVFVVMNSAADFVNLTSIDDLSSGSLNFNGDDAVGLSKKIGEIWTLIDAVGVSGADPGTGWAVAGITDATADRVLTRKNTISAPNTDWDASRGANTESSEWIVATGGTNSDASGFGSHSYSGGSSPSFVSGYNNLTVAGTTQNVSSLSQNTLYYYRVRAVGGNSTSSNSGTISVTTGRTIQSQASGNWNTAATWSSNTVPTEKDDITIISGSPVTVDVADATCANLTVNASSILSINAGQQLDINLDLTNNATQGIVLKSPLNHGAPGSLIVNGSISGSGTIKAERYIQAYTAPGDGWHLISSPVNNVIIATGTNLAPGGTDDLYAFNETLYEWTNYKPGNVFTTMDNGKGYLVSYAAAETKQFVGTPNNAAVTFNNLSKTVGEGNGWHLIGNPFQSAISWNNGGWTLTNIGGVAKRMSDAGSYSDIQATDIIPAMQGFFVQADNATNTLTIPLSARTHNSAQNWTKSGNANTLLLVAHDPAQAMYQESRLNENPEATEAYDYRFDSRFVPWYAPEFYSVSGEEMLSTNSIPDFSSDNVIPFGFKKNTSEAFYIELKEYPTGLTTYLTDTKTGTEHNFAENAIYSFSSADGDNPNRFLLHFGAVGISEQPASATLKAYVVGGQLYFPLQGEATLEIVDLQGRVLQQSKVIGQGLASQPLQLTAGAYVVRLTSGQNVQTAKVIVK